MKMKENYSCLNNSSFPLISVNWHLWPRCTNKCKFCFGTFNEIKSLLSKEEALKIPSILNSAGTEKLSLTGGEPLLCPHLGDLIIEAKKLDMTTMLITSGSLLTGNFIEEYKSYIDWIALSLDSSKEETQYKLGRGSGNHIQKIKEIVKVIHTAGIKLKINTVVTSMNWEEEMTDLIIELNPQRWKVFQVLSVKGQNDEYFQSLQISSEQFDNFVQKHESLNPIAENNELMRGSYLMLDAMGRFFQNSEGYLKYSLSILEVDPYSAIQQVGWHYEKFKKRGGIYNWNLKPRSVS